MSQMLEQAIVDAEALKDAALKTAKQEILEKYSEDVKSAVDTILEQDDLDLDLDLDVGAAPEGTIPGAEPISAAPGEEEIPGAEAPEDEDLSLKVFPYKHRTREDDNNKVSINLQQLEEQIEKVYGNMFDVEEEDEYIIITEDEKEKKEDETYKFDKDEDEDDEEKKEDDEENIEIVDDKKPYSGNPFKTSSLEEAFHLDYRTVPTGHVGAFTELEMNYAMEMEKIKEKYEKLQKKDARQRELMEQAVKALDGLEKENSSYASTTEQLKKKLYETNLTNAKLYYTNRVLASPSLNERQKKHLVEALSQADSPKQAKTIFETLQDSAGPSFSQGPKSLSEAVGGRSLLTVSPHRRKEVAAVEDEVSDRWKRLAGIN
jgi:hypothetical protein